MADDKVEDKVEDTEDKVKEPVEGEQLGSDAADDDAEGGGNPAAGEDKSEDKVEDKTEDTEDNSSDELDTDVWGSTGDEVGDSVLLVLQNSGIPMDDAKALIYDPLTEHGDPTKLDKDALVEKVGKANANLVMAGIENYLAKNNAKNEAVLKDVYAVAGGKEQWDQVAPWAKDKLSEADRKDYSDMLDAGGAKAKFAAAEIIRLYNEDPNNTSIGSTTTLEGDTTAGDQGEAIGKREYAERLQKAHRTGAKPSEIKAIQRARERGRKKGI